MQHLKRAGVGAIVIAILVACGGDSAESVDGTSLLTNASSEAQVALSVPVNYLLDDENFARWEEAQGKLDRLPTSALPKGAFGGADPIENAVARLESSPRARTAIESAGLSVRDFVLQTIALAQAADAAQTGRGSTLIPPQNIAFVADHRAQIVRAQETRKSEFEVYVEPSVEMSGSWISKQEAEARASVERRGKQDASTEIWNDPPALPPIPRELPRNQIPSTPPVLPPIPTQPPRDSLPNVLALRDSMSGVRS